MASGFVAVSGESFEGGIDINGSFDDFVLLYDPVGSTTGELTLAVFSTSSVTGLGSASEAEGSYTIRQLPTGGAVPEAASSLVWLGLLGIGVAKRRHL